MTPSLTTRAQENLVTLASGVLSFVVYLTTMNPTVSFIDTGELAAAAATLGIPHPTGYPLFTLLGRLETMMPIGSEALVRLNLAGALLVSVSAAALLRLVLFLQRALVLFPATTRIRFSPVTVLSSAFIGSLSFAFCSTVWAQSVAIEVYSLHILFLVLLILSFLKGIEETMASGILSPHLPLFSFLLGLSFANHMTTLLLAPGLLSLYFLTFRWNKESLMLLVRLVPWFVLGLSVYLFLPIRSSSSPSLDWGHPADLERFVWHISGKQYRSWIFSSFESAERQLKYFFENFPLEFHWPAIFFIVLGLWHLFWYRRRLFLLVILLLLGCLAYSVNYDIHDIDAYFLLAYLAAGLAATFGVARAMTSLAGRLPERWGRIGWTLFLILPVSQWWMNGPRVDESDNLLVHDYTQNILRSLDSNAVVLTYQWDYFVSASYFAQHVQNQRPDVVIIDKELLRRSWYFIQLERNHPWLIERSREKINAFLRELSKFEHELPYNGQLIELRYNEMINDFIDKAFPGRPVYVGPELETQFGPAYERRPEGLMLRLARPGETGPFKEFNPVYRPTRFQGRLTRGLRMQYARAFTFRALWLKERGENKGIQELLDRAITIDPTFLPAYRLKEQLYPSR